MTKKQLPAAVAKLRQRVTELEATQARHNQLVEPLKVNQSYSTGRYRARYIKYRMGKLPWS